jgi:hypothetical protein
MAGKVFFSVTMSLDGFIAPEERMDDPDVQRWTCLGKVESSSEGKRSISWASRSDDSGRNLRPKPFGWLR